MTLTGKAASGGRARKTAVVIAGALVYALLFALGSQIDETGSTAWAATWLRFAAALPVALAALWAFMRVRLPLKAPAAEPKKPFFTFGAFVLIFMSFVPLFLIEYPGTFAYDTQRQTFQHVTGEYTVFHPLAHTLLLGFCLSLYDALGSLEKCAAVYSVISMLVMAGCFSLLCSSISRSFSRRAARLATAFFCLYPAHMAFASNCTKDGLFAAFFGLFVAHAAEMTICGGKRRRSVVILVISGAMACMFRNNMIYAMAVWAVLLLCFKHMRRLGIAALVCCVLSYGGNAALAKAVNASEGSVVEMFSVPIQQLARARLLAPEAFDEEQRALLDEVFGPGLYGMYEPTVSDPVKNNIKPEVFKEKFGEMTELYLSVGRQCPNIYLDAFLNLALPSLYPYGEYHVAAPYIEVGLQNGVLTAPYGKPPMVQPARFAQLRRVIRFGLYETGADDIPVIRLLFNCGAVFWLLLALFLRTVYRGNWTGAGVLLVAVLLYGTYLLGPVMQGRYLYPFICALPVFIGCASSNSQKTKEAL